MAAFWVTNESENQDKLKHCEKIFQERQNNDKYKRNAANLFSEDKLVESDNLKQKMNIHYKKATI